MDTLKHLKIRHRLLADLVEDTEKLNTVHHDMEHNLLATLKKEKLRIKDMILELEQNQNADNQSKNTDTDH
jgi:hypothetical protein